LSRSRIAALTLGIWVVGGVASAQSAPFCSSSATSAIPSRAPDAPTGSELESRLLPVDGELREESVRHELLAGNMPRFLRQLQPVEIQGLSAGGHPAHVTLCVMPDYLAVGSDSDFLLVPMRLGTALEIAGSLGFMLPTPAIVDAIHERSSYRLAPHPLPAGPAMRSLAYFTEHDTIIRDQRTELGAPPGMLISGHKKDLVLTERLWGNLERVAIYGWHKLDGSIIQPLSLVHGWHYVDYSHGVRLVSDRILVNGQPASLLTALQDPDIGPVLNHGGPIYRLGALIAKLQEPHAL